MKAMGDPALAARVDLLLIALATHVRMTREPGFEGALKHNVEEWRDSLIATPIPEGYLEELDGAMALLLDRIRP